MLIDVTNHGIAVDFDVCPRMVIIRTRRVEPACLGQLREYLRGDIFRKTPTIEADRGDAGVYLEYRLNLLTIDGYYQRVDKSGHLFRADSAIWTDEGWSSETLSFQLREVEHGCVIALAGKRPTILSCPLFDPWATEDTPLMAKDPPLEPEKNGWAHIMGGDEPVEPV